MALECADMFPSPSATSIVRGAGFTGALVILTVIVNSSPGAQMRPDPNAQKAERTVAARATGTFEVKLTPQPADQYADGTAVARLTIDKTFTGALQATSNGQMLSAMGGVKGSAGYVAIERVSGTLAGRRGSFVLQHSGTMDRGAASLSVSVVPDSGSDELAGLAGTMQIKIEGGLHSYEFSYTVPR